MRSLPDSYRSHPSGGTAGSFLLITIINAPAIAIAVFGRPTQAIAAAVIVVALCAWTQDRSVTRSTASVVHALLKALHGTTEDAGAWQTRSCDPLSDRPDGRRLPGKRPARHGARRSSGSRPSRPDYHPAIDMNSNQLICVARHTQALPVIESRIGDPDAHALKRESRSVTIAGRDPRARSAVLYVFLVIRSAAMPDAEWIDLRVATAGDLRAVRLSCYRGQRSRWGRMRWWLRIPRCG